jgi:hypothetical protein
MSAAQFESPKDVFSLQPINRQQVAQKAVRGLPMDATDEQKEHALKRARNEYDQATREQTLAPSRPDLVIVPILPPPPPPAVLDLTQNVPSVPAPVAANDTETESFHDDLAASDSD